MASVKIDFVERAIPQTTIDTPIVRVVPEDTYIYKDLKLDLQLGQLYGNTPADKDPNLTDISDLRDIHAIKQSVSNIFNTRPGEKLLNPYLGIDLTKFLFDPISEQVGDLIARTILNGLQAQEPRVTITKLMVIGDVPAHTYNVSFIIDFPDLSTGKVEFNGTLSTDGFKFN